MVKFVLICTLVIFGAVLASPTTKKFQIDRNPRIIGGHNAEDGQFPYQVSYQWGVLEFYDHMCGGAIISPSWILTAAYCLTRGHVLKERIVAGTRLLFPLFGANIQIREISQKIVHPNFGGNVGPNDIGLIRVQEPLYITNFVQTIPLPNSGSEPNLALATFSGWGYTQNFLPITPILLQTLDMPVLSDRDCKDALDRFLNNSNADPYTEISNICTGPLTGGAGSCTGDIGGPLVQNGKLIGIDSWGMAPCASVGSVTVYTQVSNFIGFINQYVTDL